MKLIAKTVFILSMLIATQFFSQQIDTIKVASGKPHAFLIDIPEYPVQIVGNNLEAEKKELETNFKDQDLDVMLISEHCFIKFESGQGLDMTDLNKSYQSTAFWNGNVQDEVELYDRLTNTTEFIAEKLGVEKTSSYVDNANTLKDEVQQLISKNNFTKNSEKVLQKFLMMFHNPVLTDNEEYWYLQEIPKIKTIKILVNEGKKDQPYKVLQFNTSGQVTSETFYNEDGGISSFQKFIYNGGVLTEIQKEERSITVTFDDDKMILFENVGDADETTIYHFENNQLLSKRMILMTDDNFANQNSIREEKLENDCVVIHMDGKIIDKDCYGKDGVFPYIVSYTSYQSAADGQGSDFMNFTKFKIEKKDSNTFEKYYSDAEKPKDPDHYKLYTTFYLENNLITKLKTEKGIMKINYEYYP